MPLRKPKKAELLVDPDVYLSSTDKPSDLDPIYRKRIDEHLAHRIRLGGHITYRLDDGTHVVEDKDGIRPLTDDYVTPTPPESSELTIRELAFRNGIHATRDGLDEWAEAVSCLADDDISVDEVEQLIINLGKAKAVDGIELTKLHARYLRERGQ